jgi:OmcA/MtrC family decaheme c-type cytochrome
MGEGLSSDFNTNQTTGNFRDYTSVVFPAEVRNCNVCHADDRWKTEPTRLACGSCHDNTWFGASADKPAGMEMHEGGRQLNDNGCAFCHLPDAEEEEPAGILQNHRVAPPAFKNTIQLSLTPPANGGHYAAGDKPQVTIKVLDAATGVAINPSNSDPYVPPYVREP